jgi:hypothetical protein
MYPQNKQYYNVSIFKYKKVKVKIPLTGPVWPRGFQEA